MSSSLPLPRGFFDANRRVSEDLRRQYIEYAEASIRKVFALSDCHQNSWIPVREKKNVAVYRNFCHKRGPNTSNLNVTEVGGKSEFHASLDAIGRAYSAHDDALFRRLMKKVNPRIMDAAVIANIVPRSPLAPFRYIGIKWFAVKTPTPLVSHRDYCCLEVQDKIVDSYGNEMYIRVLHSIDVNECPSLENSHGLVRAKMLAGYMYRRDVADPKLIRVHHVARFDPCGYFPSQWLYKTAEAELITSIVQIRRIIEKQQMNACTFVDKRQWVPNEERTQCVVCSRAFGTFRPRHHCRCCGEVICGKCSIFRAVDVPGTTLKNVRICSVCNMGVQRSGDPQDIEDSMSDASATSVTSTSTIAHNEMSMMDLYLSANNPGTPSEYSSASTQSNISIRSTASSRSVVDARSRAQSNQTTIYRSGAQQRYYNHTMQATSRGDRTPRALVNGSFVSRSTSDDYAMDRMSAYKQRPLDIGYLRDSVRQNAGANEANQVTETTEGNQAPDESRLTETEGKGILRSARSFTSGEASATPKTGSKKPFFGGLFTRASRVSQRYRRDN